MKDSEHGHRATGQATTVRATPSKTPPKIRTTKFGHIVITVNVIVSIGIIVLPLFFDIDQIQNQTILSTLFFTPLSCLAIATDFHLYRELRFLLLSGNILLVLAMIISACSPAQIVQHTALLLGSAATLAMLNGSIVLLPGRERKTGKTLNLSEWKNFR